MKYKLNDLTKWITKGTTPTTIGFKYTEDGVNFIKSECLVNKPRLDLSSRSFINDECNEKLKRSKLEENDILISIAGAYLGKTGIVSKDILPANTNQAVGIIRCKDDTNYKYIYYWLSCDKTNKIINSYNSQSAQPNINLTQLGSLEIELPSTEKIQHIVDTIGSVDDLIENIEEKTQQIKDYGNKLFSKISLDNLEFLTNKVSFSKGKEIGSLNYLDKQTDDSVPYIRVGDLLDGSHNTFTTIKDVPLCNEEDILITFDGAPGRNNYGLKGAISSGVQKVICKPEIKGFIYFYLNSDLCQNTIQTNAQGTTILHASKAIKELKIPVIGNNNIYQKFDNLFNYLIILSKEKTVLQKQKELLLKQYFG